MIDLIILENLEYGSNRLKNMTCKFRYWSTQLTGSLSLTHPTRYPALTSLPQLSCLKYLALPPSNLFGLYLPSPAQTYSAYTFPKPHPASSESEVGMCFEHAGFLFWGERWGCKIEEHINKGC